MKIKFINKKIIIILLFIFICLFSFLILYKYIEYKNLLKNSNNLIKIESQKILSNVGEMFLLPKDEIPTIATITDKNQLEKSDFYKQTDNGDKLIIYSKNQLAIVYRPSINKIITSAKINSSNNIDIVKNISIKIYNASGVTGLAEKYKNELEKLKTTELIISTDNYVNTDNLKIFSNTIYVNNQKINLDYIKNITNTLKANISLDKPPIDTNEDFIVIILN